jgi:hypothetical protein
MGNPDAMAPSDLDLKIGSKLPKKHQKTRGSSYFSIIFRMKMVIG